MFVRLGRRRNGKGAELDGGAARGRLGGTRRHGCGLIRRGVGGEGNCLGKRAHSGKSDVVESKKSGGNFSKLEQRLGFPPANQENLSRMSQPAPSTALDYPDPLRIPISPTSTESAQSPSARAQSAPAHRDDHKGTASLFSDYSSPRAEPQEPQNRPRKISHSDDSWSQVSASPVLQPASHGRGDAQSPAASNPPRDSCQPASALSRNAIEDQLSRQEAQGMLTTVTRSQSDFSRWLETTVSQARGDGTSTVSQIPHLVNKVD